MESNKYLQKCGEILVDIKAKTKKNKIYIFQCTLCDIQCDQLKKFSLHIGEEHLNDFDEILRQAQNEDETQIVKETELLKETELKFEAEPEEFKIPSFNDIEETPDIKVFPSPIETKINTNPDPLDTVTAAPSTSTNTENFNCEIKYEIIEHDDEGAGGGSGAGDMEIMDGTVSISDSDKSDSDEEYIEEVPHKKRKTNKNAKKGKQTKPKETANDTDSDESKDAECNNTVARQQNLTREERLEKKRAAERLRYQRIKNDPEKYALLKAKEHMKYQQKKEKGKIKTVNQMTNEEKEQARKLWREKTKRQRLRHFAKIKFKLENSSTSSDTSYLNKHKTSFSYLHNKISCQDNSCQKNASQEIKTAPKDTSLNYLTTSASTFDNPLRNNTSLCDETTEETSTKANDSSCSSENNVSKETSADCSTMANSSTNKIASFIV